MKFNIITIFPEMFNCLEHGIVGRAQKNNLICLNYFNPRDYTNDPYRRIDDRPYGGGPGMVMMPEPIHAAITAAKRKAATNTKTILLSPQGKTLNQDAMQNFAQMTDLILVAGRYEGIDERIIDQDIDEEWSVGDYVVSGGELPAMLLIDAITRLLPGSLGDEQSAQQDSFMQGLLDCPHYTRPELFNGQQVPKMLLSGDHKAVARWRLQQALGRTYLRRPDLLQQKQLTTEEQQLLAEFINELKER